LATAKGSLTGATAAFQEQLYRLVIGRLVMAQR
jgi:hypothetical protein